jgi:glycosyltransferase involved in cell wall biosynthesis
MKIAMVSEHASPLACLGGVDAGGQNVHVAELSLALARRGHSIVVYTRADRPGLARRVTMAPGVQVEHVTAGPLAGIGKDELLPHMPAFAAQLARRWRRDRPDVAHAHFWMSGLAATEAGALTSVPVVQTFHALGTVKHRWQPEADTSPESRIGTERRVARTVERIIATCTDEVKELTSLGASRSSIDVVPCGVDVELFRPSSIRPGTARPRRLLVLGRLVPRKGVEDAIRALAAIPDTELLVVGGPAAQELDADPEVRRLRSVCDAVGVIDRVRFAGRVAHGELPAVISSCDLLLAVPWYEPFGIAPLEAMACGLPVVANAVGGMLDTVVPGRTGMLVPPGDQAALISTISNLLDDAPLRRRMSAAAVRRARDLYTWDAVAARTEQSYLSVLAGRGDADTVAGVGR